MKNCIKGFFYSCIPTVEDLYDLTLKTDGDAITICGIRRHELVDCFTEAGDSLFLTIKLFEDDPADAVVET